MIALAFLFFSLGFMAGDFHKSDAGPCKNHGGIFKSVNQYDENVVTCADLSVHIHRYDGWVQYSGPAKITDVIYKFSLSDFQDADRTYVPVPRDFLKFKALYQFFGREECENAVVKEVRENGYVFVFTSDGSCDGGNSYGLVYKDATIMGIIQDSWIYPITLDDIRKLK